MCSPGNEQNTRRLFLALWPEAAERRQLAVAPIHWRINQVALVESLRQGAGSIYQVTRRWPAG
jgi:2'-5' RNA ligase